MLNFNSVYLQANYLFLKSYYSATRLPERNHFRHYYSIAGKENQPEMSNKRFQSFQTIVRKEGRKKKGEICSNDLKSNKRGER